MFIESEGRILDAVKLRKDQLLLKKILEWEAEQILLKYGFERVDEELFRKEEVFMLCKIHIHSEV